MDIAENPVTTIDEPQAPKAGEYKGGAAVIPLEMIRKGFPENGFPDGISLVKRLLEHTATATTDQVDSLYEMDPKAYIDEDLFRRERDWMKNELMQCVALSGDVAKPGDYLAMTVLDVPILITRCSDGRASAFLNICRHRGARVAQEGFGSSKNFSCKYHGWVYSNEGALKSIPHSECFGASELSDRDGLIKLPIREESGMIFVGLTPDVKNELVGQEKLLEMMAPLKLGEWSRIDNRQWTRKFNWKLAVDTFMENYHFEFAHSQTVQQYLFSNHMAVDKFENCSRMCLPARSIEYLRSIPEKEWVPTDHLTVMFHLFPCVTMVMQGYMISMVQMYPGKTVDEVHVVHSVYSPKAIESEAEKAFRDQFVELVNFALDAEDFGLSAEIFQSSLTQAQTSVFGRNEIPLQLFHKALDRAVPRVK